MIIRRRSEVTFNRNTLHYRAKLAILIPPTGFPITSGISHPVQLRSRYRRAGTMRSSVELNIRRAALVTNFATPRSGNRVTITVPRFPGETHSGSYSLRLVQLRYGCGVFSRTEREREKERERSEGADRAPEVGLKATKIASRCIVPGCNRLTRYFTVFVLLWRPLADVGAA